MATLAEYAAMARLSYQLPDRESIALPSWTLGECSHTAGHRTGGFTGGVFESEHERVVVFQGTSHLRDVLADLNLALGISPRQTSAAHQLLGRARKPGTRVTLVGHSLGGGLAQVVSHWHKVPFVTFNAPPMLGTIQKTKINPLMPQRAWRSIRASFRSRAAGFNYRMRGDVVSSRLTSTLGHYGPVITWHADGTGRATPLRSHRMETIEDYLRIHPEIAGQDPFVSASG